MRRIGVVARLFLLLAVVATWSGAGGVTDASAQTGAASLFIRQFGDEAVTTLQSTGLSLEEREARFQRILRNGFDLPSSAASCSAATGSKSMPSSRATT